MVENRVHTDLCIKYNENSFAAHSSFVRTPERFCFIEVKRWCCDWVHLMSNWGSFPDPKTELWDFKLRHFVANVKV